MSRDYWLNRINKQSLLTDEAVEKQLKRLYRASAERIKTEYMSLYYQVMSEVNSGEPFSPSHIYRLNRYYEVQEKLNAELRKLGEKEIALLNDKLSHEYFNIYNDIPLEPFTAITLDKAAAAVKVVWVDDGLTFSDRVWKNMELLKERLDTEFIHAVSTGDSEAMRQLTRDLTQDILQTMPTQKVNYHGQQLDSWLKEDFDKAYRNAKRLIRTESAHVQTMAAIDRYKEAGVAYVTFMTAEGCCEACEELDGKLIPIDDNSQMPPLHPNCKCTLVPVLD